MRMVEHRAWRKSREAARTNMTATPLLLSDNPVECMLDDLIGGSRRSVFSKWLMGYEPPACARRDATMTRQRPSPPASPYRNYQDHGGSIAFLRKGCGVSQRDSVGGEGTGGSRIQTKGRQDSLDFRKFPDGDITVGAGDGQLIAVRAPSQPPNRAVVIGK